MQENARQGYWNGSVPPFGYRAVTTDTVGNRGRHKRRLEIDPVESETVREIYRLYLAGRDGQVMGMKAIATHLNRQGLSMRGRPWRIQKVNRLLADPLYTGCFYFNRRDSRTHKERPQPEWIAVSVPAIIDAGTFERAAKRRESSHPKAGPRRAMASPAPLVGLPKCGHCRAGNGKSGPLSLLQAHHARPALGLQQAQVAGAGGRAGGAGAVRGVGAARAWRLVSHRDRRARRVATGSSGGRPVRAAAKTPRMGGVSSSPYSERLGQSRLF
jgi:hypothetical protein